MPVQLKFVLLVAAFLALLSDAVFPARLTGSAALLAMAGVLVLGWRAAWRKRSSLSVLAKLGSILQLEMVLLGAQLFLALARAFILFAQFGAQPAAGHVTAARTYDLLFAVLGVTTLAVLFEPNRVARLFLRLARRPAMLLAGSFVLLIAIGSFLLTLPISVVRIADISFIDSLFTMTSAVCVTGLTVNDVGTTYTRFGQGVLLAGIQLGGIGMMTFAAFALSFRHDRALREQGQYATMFEVGSLGELRRTVRAVIFTTLGIELVGAVALHSALDPATPARAWIAVFHSVSAFCNAGFALFPNSLTGFRGAYGLQAVVMLLIVAGGIGFPVLREVAAMAARKLNPIRRLGEDPPRLSLNARVAIAASGILIVGGATAVVLLESFGVLAPLGATERLFAALFTSVTARTAGFNTVDFGAMREATLLIVMGLMFIGASPASTGGGVKTTTAAVIVATLVAELRGREPQLLGRTLATETTRRAVALVAVGGAMVMGSLLLLTLTENLPFLPLAFEAVSAFSTAGLSTGITAQLSAAGKLILVAAMFVGRVGPLTVAIAVGERQVKQPYSLPKENLTVG